VSCGNRRHASTRISRRSWIGPLYVSKSETGPDLRASPPIAWVAPPRSRRCGQPTSVPHGLTRTAKTVPHHRLPDRAGAGRDRADASPAPRRGRQYIARPPYTRRRLAPASVLWVEEKRLVPAVFKARSAQTLTASARYTRSASWVWLGTSIVRSPKSGLLRCVCLDAAGTRALARARRRPAAAAMRPAAAQRDEVIAMSTQEAIVVPQ
jgi:hypothetical protein